MTDNLDVSEADFSTIKANLITYLKNQSQFSDYVFTGSALNIFLDILAYNTHVMAAHSNLAFAEAFLDSAVLRGSVVSRAKELGYVPRSPTAAVATINLSFSVAGNPDEYVLPQGTKFTASAGGTTLNFTTTHDCVFTNVSNVYSQNIDIYNGKYSTYTYTVDLSDASQRFIIPNAAVDTQFLSVLFKANSGVADWTQYTYIKDLSIGALTSTTQVYFLRETFDGFFDVYFGDDVIGVAVANNNMIQLSFVITDGSAGNGAQSFALTSSLSGVSAVSISTVAVSAGGADIESVESIKYLAPFYYQSQGRAVTEDDYKALLMNSYSNLDDVAVWGGEKNIPPFYGKVFIAVKPHDGEFISPSIKEAIQNDIISRFNILSIRPEIVDPDFIEVAVKVVATYNARLFNTTSNISLDTIIRTAVSDFFDSQANKFGQPLYYSKLVTAIEESSDLILNATVNLTLQKSTDIFAGLAGTYTFQFNNTLYPGSVLSNDIVIDNVTWKIKDVPTGPLPYVTGTLAIYRITDGNNITYLNQAAGTVNYNTGEIVLNNVKIDSIIDTPITKILRLTVAPGSFADINNPNVVYVDQNVYTNKRDQIITLQDSGISVTLLADESV